MIRSGLLGSPSLSVNYYKERTQRSVDIPFNNPNDLIERHRSSKDFHQNLNIQMGGLLNNKSIFLGATLGYTNQNYSGKYSTDNEQPYSYSYTDHYLNPTGVLGVYFPKKENSFLGFSTTVKYSYFKIISSTTHYFVKYSYSYGNINFRIWKIILGCSLGATYTRSIIVDSNNSMYLGFKTKKWKATIGLRKYKDAINFGETTFAYNF